MVDLRARLIGLKAGTPRTASSQCLPAGLIGNPPPAQPRRRARDGDRRPAWHQRAADQRSPSTEARHLKLAALAPLVVPERPDPRRMRGRRRLVDEIGFRFRRHGDGGDVGSAALRLHAPSASASLRAASFSRSMCSLPTRTPKGRNISVEGRAVNAPHQGCGKLVSALTSFRGLDARFSSSALAVATAMASSCRAPVRS